MVSRNQYKVLMIGCGNIAGRFDMTRPKDALPVTQAGAFCRHYGFNLSACVDPEEVARSSFSDYWSIPRQAENIEGLTSKVGEFDVISICSPTALHHKHLEEALSLKPRLIFCEKPVTSTAEQTAEWNQICDEQSVRLVVNYTRQWDPAVARIEQEIHSGKWGSIRAVACYYNKGVLNNGGHIFDILLRLLGPLNVVAATHPVYDHWDSDPTLAALLVSRGAGIPVSLNPSHARDYAFFEIELICEFGVIRMHNGGLAWSIAGAEPSPHFNGYRVLAKPEYIDGEYLQSMTLAIDEIYAFLNEGKSVRSNGSNALAVQLICEKLLEASRHPTSEKYNLTKRQL